MSPFDFSLPTRESLKADRLRALAGKRAVEEEARWGDITPLAVASAIELLLALLFLIGRDTVPRHPGLDHLDTLLARKDEGVFDRIWQALGGNVDANAIHDALDRYSKFEGRYTWVIVPLYADDRTVRVLHKLMAVMVDVGLARRKYTGGGMVARWYMRGWDSVRRGRVEAWRSGPNLSAIRRRIHGVHRFADPPG